MRIDMDISRELIGRYEFIGASLRLVNKTNHMFSISTIYSHRPTHKLSWAWVRCDGQGSDEFHRHPHQSAQSSDNQISIVCECV